MWPEALTFFLFSFQPASSTPVPLPVVMSAVCCHDYAARRHADWAARDERPVLRGDRPAHCGHHRPLRPLPRVLAPAQRPQGDAQQDLRPAPQAPPDGNAPHSTSTPDICPREPHPVGTGRGGEHRVRCEPQSVQWSRPAGQAAVPCTTRQWTVRSQWATVQRSATFAGIAGINWFRGFGIQEFAVGTVQPERQCDLPIRRSLVEVDQQ